MNGQGTIGSLSGPRSSFHFCHHYPLSLMAFAHLIWIIKFVSIELFILLFYYTFNLHSICRDYPALISDISNLCSFSFVSVSLSRGLLIFLIFSNNHLLVSLILPINLQFHIYLFLFYNNSYYVFTST